MALDKEKVDRYNELIEELEILQKNLEATSFFSIKIDEDIWNGDEEEGIPNSLTEPIKELIKERINNIKKELEEL